MTYTEKYQGLVRLKLIDFDSLLAILGEMTDEAEKAYALAPSNMIGQNDAILRMKLLYEIQNRAIVRTDETKS